MIKVGNALFVAKNSSTSIKLSQSSTESSRYPPGPLAVEVAQQPMSPTVSALAQRGLYQDVPPDARTGLQDNPTLLMSWWCTGFSLVIILIRLAGRYVRTERFFLEDKVMVASIVPLVSRMSIVHVVLIWGTNNTKTDGLSDLDIRHREIGSRLVLASRISYAVFIWMTKYTVCEFLRRMTGMTWNRGIHVAIRFVEFFLASTLLAVILATLLECPHQNHQVVPDPGPYCRLGYANLLTMGVCDVITDIFLVCLPIPMILMSTLPVKRKVGLILLFALSMALVAITCYRVPMVIAHHGLQPYRSLLASLEILAATAVSNAVVIGSFVRDRGLKKAKFRHGASSVNESIEYNSVRRATIAHQQWGSDADLVSSLGYSIDWNMQLKEISVRPAPVAISGHEITERTGTVDPNRTFPGRHPSVDTDEQTTVTDRVGTLKAVTQDFAEPRNRDSGRSESDDHDISLRKVSFFDVGGLLDPPSPSTTLTTYPRPALCHPTTSLLEQSPQTEASPFSQSRRGSQAPLQDDGDFLSPHNSSCIASSLQWRLESSSQYDLPASSHHQKPSVGNSPMDVDDIELYGAGGLLDEKFTVGR